jgi:hypothetical protein
VTRGAEPRLNDREGLSAFDWAVRQRHIKIATFLSEC